jgi:CheY-like chemotaxis protein
MQVPSFEEPLPEAVTGTSIPFSTSPKEGRGSADPIRASKKETHRGGRKLKNRVMIVGRIRELALYRAEVLRHQGFHVLTPETKEEAMAMIRNASFDVAVLSYTLPSTLVQEIAEEIREVCADCRIVTIAESARFDRRIAPDAVAVAEEGPPGLVAAIRKVLHAAD